jgi:hypothetical protein
MFSIRAFLIDSVLLQEETGKPGEKLFDRVKLEAFFSHVTEVKL